MQIIRISHTKHLTQKESYNGESSRKNIVLSRFTLDALNIAADALSRLDIVDTPNPVKINIESVNEHYGLGDEDVSYPTNYKTIMRYQQKDKKLINIAQNKKD